jgi:hypothetical protein
MFRLLTSTTASRGNVGVGVGVVVGVVLGVNVDVGDDVAVGTGVGELGPQAAREKVAAVKTIVKTVGTVLAPDGDL